MMFCQFVHDTNLQFVFAVRSLVVHIYHVLYISLYIVLSASDTQHDTQNGGSDLLLA